MKPIQAMDTSTRQCFWEIVQDLKRRVTIRLSYYIEKFRAQQTDLSK